MSGELTGVAAALPATGDIGDSSVPGELTGVAAALPATGDVGGIFAFIASTFSVTFFSPSPKAQFNSLIPLTNLINP